jgi:hypothetical protein
MYILAQLALLHSTVVVVVMGAETHPEGVIELLRGLQSHNCLLPLAKFLKKSPLAL